ncbi:MAG: DUF5317 domain-containing protein [Anaerolineales bacterium]|nr:DUF5317 domain-containing protein [Anaerolineales bacterium]
MILAYAIIVLIILAILFRRDLSALGQFSFRGGWIFIGGVMGLFILQAGLVTYAPGQSLWQMIILNLSQIALIALFLLNHQIPGAKLFALGVALNVLVMVVNGGWMPVTPEMTHFVHPDRPVIEQVRPGSSKNIILPRSETNLWVLSDIIPVILPWRRNAVSVGDILLVAGTAQFIFQATAKKKRNTLAAGQV